MWLFPRRFFLGFFPFHQPFLQLGGAGKKESCSDQSLDQQWHLVAPTEGGTVGVLRFVQSPPDRVLRHLLSPAIHSQTKTHFRVPRPLGQEDRTGSCWSPSFPSPCLPLKYPCHLGPVPPDLMLRLKPPLVSSSTLSQVWPRTSETAVYTGRKECFHPANKVKGLKGVWLVQ